MVVNYSSCSGGANTVYIYLYKSLFGTLSKRFQVFERIDKDGSGQLTLEDLIEGVAVLVGFKPLASV